MYESYWNLRSSPFLNTEDEAFLYLSDQLREGVARLYYLIDQERIAGMVTGVYGVGKTSLLACVVRRAKKAKLPVIRFDAIPQGGLPMARHVLGRLGIDGNPPALADALMSLQQRCTDGGRPLQRHVLVIDEAHYLADGDGLYLVHFLCNLRIRSATGEKPLFTIILSGTPDLAQSVARYESLRHRIQLSWTLDPLSRGQTVEYVQQRMRAAGGDIWAFTREALDVVHERSGGIPRSINNICDTALMLGFAAGAGAVTPEIAMQAAEDTGLGPEPPAPAATNGTPPPVPGTAPETAPRPPAPAPVQ